MATNSYWTYTSSGWTIRGTGQQPSIVLQNWQSLIEDLLIANVKVAEFNIVSILPSLDSTEGVTTSAYVIADWKVRLEVVNQTGEEFIVPIMSVTVKSV